MNYDSLTRVTPAIAKKYNTAKTATHVADVCRKYTSNGDSAHDFNHAFFHGHLVSEKGKIRTGTDTLLTHSGPWSDLAKMREELDRIPGLYGVYYNLD